MKKFSLIILIILICNLTVTKAQKTFNNKDDFFEYLQGGDSQSVHINIYQSHSIKSLINKIVSIHAKQRGIEGYRIQIFSASGQQARNSANKMRSEFVSKYPNFDYNLIYPLYQPPFFKIRVGDYRTKNEALKFYKQVENQFPNAYIVKAIINYPKL